MVKRALTLAVVVMLVPALAGAQADRLGGSFKIAVPTTPLVRMPDVDRDSVNGVYLAVTGAGSIRGIFLNNGGVAVSAPFTINQTTRYAAAPRVTYSAAQQTFIVTWHEAVSATSNANNVKVRLVKYGAGPVGAEALVSSAGSFWEYGPDAAASPGEFLAAWISIDVTGTTTKTYNYNVYARRLGPSGAPVGPIIPISKAADYEREPVVSYNPSSNAYLVAWAGYNDAGKYAYVRGRTIPVGSDAPGPLVQYQKASSTYLPSMALNTSSNKYLLTWYQTVAGVKAIYGLLINPDGAAATAPAPLNTKYAFYDGNDVDYNPISGTYFGVGHGATYDDTGYEVSSTLVPRSPFYVTHTAGILGAKATSGNYNPRIAPSTSTKNWLVVTSTNYVSLTGQLIQSASQDGGGTPPPPPPPGSQPLMDVGTPSNGGTVVMPLTISGWAVDKGAATGSGVDAVHLYAYPNPGSGQPAVFLGVANYGLSRADVANVLDDSQFINSGFLLSIDGLEAGTHRIVAFAHSTVANAFNQAKAVTVTVKGTRMSLDSPANHTTAPAPLFVSGWAADNSGSSGTGVDAVHVYAYPDPGSNTPAIFLGVAAYGLVRSDVAGLLGSPRFQNSGFLLSVSNLTAGSYRLVAYAHSTVRNAFTAVRTADVTITAGPQLAVDTPANNASVPASFAVNGWAIDLTAPSGTGVNAVHVWAYPVLGGSPLFVGAAQLGITRADVANAFGARALSSGFTVPATLPLPKGSWVLHIFARSTATGTFNNVATRLVTVP